jgi:hypothetical protein
VSIGNTPFQDVPSIVWLALDPQDFDMAFEIVIPGSLGNEMTRSSRSSSSSQQNGAEMTHKFVIGGLPIPRA